MQDTGTHLIHLHNYEEVIVIQVNLMASANDGGNLFDHAITSKDIVVAKSGPNSELDVPPISLRESSV